jgi:hypothetical protein
VTFRVLSIYEPPLKERFDQANQQFSEIYFRKARLARAGVRPYSGDEFIHDLYAAAGDYGLFAAALWAYFRMLHSKRWTG